ncbi:MULTISPECIES: poly-gamma-glutamate hydrolase family protein [unclassified Streptomyces]|uniref:Poly-gamma-glutamate hydrolase family protein n=1 Tax=Streptomyces sp. NBC_00060 TaxID=2975636 RepID=A0AAU2H6Z8_9ACTN
MTSTSRRTVLTALATATVAGPLMGGLGASAAHATGTNDLYSSNTDLYTQLTEGTDFGRRYKRHEQVDSDQKTAVAYGRTAILALHGGGIEGGTSELCLGIAGYDPATLAPKGGPAYDYWMFEAIRSSNNAELHVTSKNCDDKVALSIAAANLNVVSLHGCTASQAGAPTSRPEAVVVGGLNATLKTYLHDALRAAGFQTIDGSTEPDLAGVDPTNICNRTLLGKGAQLEITTELRKAMFTVNTIAGRATSTTAVYDGFVAAVRTAVARLEASGGEQIIL